MGILSCFFGQPEALGKVIYYIHRPNRWRWKVVNAKGNVILNPIKSLHSKELAEQNFQEMLAIVESLQNY